MLVCLITTGIGGQLGCLEFRVQYLAISVIEGHRGLFGVRRSN